MMRPAIPAFSLTPRLAIAMVFLIRGFIVGNWFPRIPGIIEKLGTSSSEMGLVWFSVAVMNIVAFSVAARIMRQLGSARSYLFFSLPYPLVFVLAGLAPTIPAFWAVMLLFGFLNGGFDVSASVQGGIVERATRKPLFSALFGCFSLGALVGSFCSGIIAQQGVPPGLQFGVIAVVATPLFLVMHSRLLPDEKHAAPARVARRFTLPPRALLPLGVTIICIGLGEESINNWVALYMRSDLGSNPAIAGFAYTAFSIATFLGRVVGDRVILRFGIDRVLSTGAVMAAGGIAFGILVNEPWAMVAGYTVVGAGLSLVVPITYRRAGEVPGLSPADAVSRVASIGFTGFMFGPILIGFLSDLLSLRFALGVIALSLLGIVLMVRINPHSEHASTDEASPASVTP
jgi:MFS family permease